MTDADMQALDPKDTFLFGARAATAQRGKYLLLVLDEIEAVWRKTGQSTEMSVLGDQTYALLWHLINNGHGGVGTLICGAMTVGHLIQGLPVDGYRQRMSLNSTKIPLMRMGSVEPTDHRVATECVKIMRPDLSARTASWVETLTAYVHWTCGTSPRKAAVIMQHVGQHLPSSVLQVWTLYYTHN